MFIDRLRNGFKYLSEQDTPLLETVIKWTITPVLKKSPTEIFRYLFLSSDRKLQLIANISPDILCEEIAVAINVTSLELLEYHKEFKNDLEFHRAIYEKLIVTPERVVKNPDFDYRELLYIIVRAVKPNMFIETGSFDGLSTSVILLAMHKNNKGKCFTIDLPNPRLPKGKEPAWIVPDYIRDRLILKVGKTSTYLKSIVQEVKPDMFYHDSWHSYQNMMYEYNTAWEALLVGGYFISEYIDFNRAFKEFTKNKEPIMLANNTHFVVRKV
jgi:predicted O-methyltransferase YrrM